MINLSKSNSRKLLLLLLVLPFSKDFRCLLLLLFDCTDLESQVLSSYISHPFSLLLLIMSIKVSLALSIENLLRLNKELGSLLVRHLTHSIITEVSVQFEVLVLLTLRVEGKVLLTKVVVDAGTTVFAPAVLAPVISRFHQFSLVGKSSRVLPGKVAGRFSDRVKGDRERFPILDYILHINSLVRDLLTTVIGSVRWIKVHLKEVMNLLAITIFLDGLTSPDACEGL